MNGIMLAASHAQAASGGGGGGLIGPALILLLGVILGRWWGRRAGLRHLGEAEFRNRWANVKQIRRF